MVKSTKDLSGDFDGLDIAEGHLISRSFIHRRVEQAYSCRKSPWLTARIKDYEAWRPRIVKMLPSFQGVNHYDQNSLEAQ